MGGKPVNEKELQTIVGEITESVKESLKYNKKHPRDPVVSMKSALEKPAWYEELGVSQQSVVLKQLSDKNINDDTQWGDAKTRITQIASLTMIPFAKPITESEAKELRDYLRSTQQEKKCVEDEEWDRNVPPAATSQNRAMFPRAMVVTSNTWILDKMLKQADGRLPTTKDFNVDEDLWRVTMETLIFSHLVNAIYEFVLHVLRSDCLNCIPTPTHTPSLTIDIRGQRSQNHHIGPDGHHSVGGCDEQLDRHPAVCSRHPSSLQPGAYILRLHVQPTGIANQNHQNRSNGSCSETIGEPESRQSPGCTSSGGGGCNRVR
jgi:hypothetical protein